MRKLLIIGAGRSATSLIHYMLDKSEANDWEVTVADYDLELAKRKVGNSRFGTAVKLDIRQAKRRKELIGNADIVVSLLPASMHKLVAKDCLEQEKHLITASYVSKEMSDLSEKARAKGLIFMGEMGLDPGIDHMSAMEKIHEIREKGGEITAFKSYTGGLIAPECDDNPWHYKFTWNPRNVVLAGQGTAQYLEDGEYKYIPYNRLFQEYELIEIQGMGRYEVYANRDSLLYREAYGLEDIPHIVRGTIRCKGFCDAWNALVQLGLTDDSYPILESHKMTYNQWLRAYIPHPNGNLRKSVAEFLELGVSSEVIDKLEWLGLFEEQEIPLKKASPAQILLNLLLGKWDLKQDDRDMIIMQHEIEYVLEGEERLLKSTMIMKGENAEDTAMARLVGLPIGIFVKNVMEGKIQYSEKNIPIKSEVYTPVLNELQEFGVNFVDSDELLEKEAVE